MSKFRYWDVVDQIPDGWSVDKTAGSPLPRSVFVTNGKSVISGKQERKILIVSKISCDSSLAPKIISDANARAVTPGFAAAAIN